MRDDYGGTLTVFCKELRTQDCGLFHCPNSIFQLQVKDKAVYLKKRCIPTLIPFSNRCRYS